MLGTVRTRILFFALLCVCALAGLATLSWSIIVKAESAADNLIGHSLQESWLLADLESQHRRLQDLAYKIKAQLLLWDEIDTEFESLKPALQSTWTQVGGTPGLESWAAEHQDAFDQVQALMAAMAKGIAEKSYYRVGQVVDFQLFPALTPCWQQFRNARCRAGQMCPEARTSCWFSCPPSAAF